MARLLPIDHKKCPEDIRALGTALGMMKTRTILRGKREYYLPPYNRYHAILGDPVWTRMERLGYAAIVPNKRHKVQMCYVTRKGMDYLGDYLGIKILDPEEKVRWTKKYDEPHGKTTKGNNRS